MDNNELIKFRNLQNVSENDTELIARLLFELLPQNKQSNEIALRGIAEQSKEYGDLRQSNFRDSKQREELIKLSEQLIHEVKEKGIDFSPIVSSLKLLEQVILETHGEKKQHAEMMAEKMQEKHPELMEMLKEISAKLVENKPEEIDFTPLLKAHEKMEKGGEKQHKELIKTLKENKPLKVEIPEFPKEIEVKKPSWYKTFDFKLDLSPLTSLLSPIKELLDKIALKEPQNIPIERGRVLVEVDRTGGSGSGIIDTSGNPVNVATEETLQNLLGFGIPPYDYISLTYVSAGNGAGEIETATFKNGGSGGTTVSTLTLAYNAAGEISSVTKS